MNFAAGFNLPKKALAIAITLIIFGGGSYLLGWSSLFTVKQIEVTGAPSLNSEKEATKSLNISLGDKLARVDSRALANRLKTNDWIKSADISRNWFNGKVTVNLLPRTPVALYTEPGKPQVALDASGVTFKLQAEIPTGLPNVSSSSVASGLIAIDVFTQMPKEFSDGIDRLTAASPRNILINGKFSGRTMQIIWGDGEDTSLKLKVITALLDLPENKSIRLIDVTAPHAPIVK
jgi:cell division septal protein FtsQ